MIRLLGPRHHPHHQPRPLRVITQLKVGILQVVHLVWDMAGKFVSFSNHCPPLPFLSQCVRRKIGPDRCARPQPARPPVSMTANRDGVGHDRIARMNRKLPPQPAESAHTARRQIADRPCRRGPSTETAGFAGVRLRS